eukprot:TRINITY_DN28597_c0_g1_i3.p1 TRINITY_DN28597_c0_g1~~TRINITY_DN28597_c0_g1_i3.p1  ORF type:complete len:376 (+),score=32.37 TRINITY_DN28597_c0_g1_i3:69-1196(+)
MEAQVIHDAFTEQAETFGLVGVAWRVETGTGAEPDVSEGFYGVCHAESTSPLKSDLKWHWGSCTKALTATLVAVLVDGNTFAKGWDTQLGDILDRALLSTDHRLTSLSLRELATHRAGICVDLDNEEEMKLQSTVASLSPVEQRRAYFEHVVAKPLLFEPGKAFSYSNAGYVILSVAAETAAGQPWEDLMTTLICKPLHMPTLGFGMPAKDVADGEPVGHNEEGEVDNSEDNVWHRASFSVHSSLADWAKFVRLHLRFLSGHADAFEVISLTPESAAVIQRPVSPSTEGEPYFGPERPLWMALGWKALWSEPEEGNLAAARSTGVLYHWGTNFKFNSGAYLRAEPPMLIVGAANSGSCVARMALRLAFDNVIDKV